MKKSLAHVHTRAIELLASATIEAQDVAIQALSQLQEVFARAPEVRRVLADASISLEKRVGLLEKNGSLSLSPAVVNVLKQMMETQALDALPALLQHIARVREHYGVAREVTVFSAVPLVVEEREKLQSVLKGLWDTHVILHERVDSTVIGGLQLRSDDWFFDATVRGRASRLAQAMIAHAV